MKRLLLILNPSAGKMKSKTALFDIVDILCRGPYLVTTQITTHRGHAAELARTAAETGHSLIVCCGGDGTLSETVDGNMHAKKPLPIGYIPAGSTNDFAASAGIPADPAVAAARVAAGKPVPFDLGRFGADRYFTYSASFGAFTAASYSAPQPAKNRLGHMAYILEGVKDISKIKPYHVRVEADGAVYEDDYVFGAVCNSVTMAGMVKFKSDIVDMQDGRLEVVLIKMPATLADLTQIVHALPRLDCHNDHIDLLQAQEIRFTLPEALPWSLDGECADGEQTVTITTQPGALKLIQ